MRLSITLLLLLFAAKAFPQSADTIAIRQKSVKYYLTKTCYDFVKWEEVMLKNKVVTAKINDVIGLTATGYQLPEGDSELVYARCHKQLEYDADGKVVYAKNNLISCSFSSYTYYKGAAHGQTEFSTLNFNALTGEELSFRDFIDSSKTTALNALLLNKLKERLKGFERDFDYWQEQFPTPQFTISDKGLLLQLKGNIYALSIIDVLLTKEELKPFIANNGLLRA